MARLTIVASMRPSTTSVSQSSISTPFSLMLGPTMSLLPAPSLGRVSATGSAIAGAEWVGTRDGVDTSAGDAVGWLAAAGGVAVVSRTRGSRRPNRFSPYFIVGLSLGLSIRRGSLTIRAKAGETILHSVTHASL